MTMRYHDENIDVERALDGANNTATSPVVAAANERAREYIRRAREAHNRARFYLANLRKSEPVIQRWRITTWDEWGYSYLDRRTGTIKVIESVLPYGAHQDELWYHVSYSRRGRIPTYDDTQLVRQDFIGEDRECYAVYPTRDRYVNINPYVLHLWYAIDHPRGVLPDFRIAGGI